MYTVFDEDPDKYLQVEEPDPSLPCTYADYLARKFEERLESEILSPGNSRKEVRLKFELYEESGVNEYRIVHPAEENVSGFIVNDQARYDCAAMYTRGDTQKSKAVPGLTVDVSGFFIN